MGRTIYIIGCIGLSVCAVVVYDTSEKNGVEPGYEQKQIQKKSNQFILIGGLYGELLRQDRHDLIHKAVGWMLREAGKRCQKILIAFLDQYANAMPRTMLRYSIEKLSAEQRKIYMRK